jgi:nucleotide-binding universal stress UspA family protein
MKSVKVSVLVGSDFSAGAEMAFRVAIGLARRVGDGLDVVHVMPSSVEAPTELFVAGPQDLAGIAEARLKLESLFDFAASAQVPMRAHLRMGDPVTELLSSIGELRPDLVVLGSAAHGAVSRLLFGSVSDEVWRRSSSQVLIVPPARVGESADRLPVSRSGRLAWSCKECGHILQDSESVTRCAGCGDKPARWLGAQIDLAPVDELLPHVGHAVGESRERVSGAGSSVVSTEPAGSSGHDVNPELRVRY